MAEAWEQLRCAQIMSSFGDSPVIIRTPEVYAEYGVECDVWSCVSDVRNNTSPTVSVMMLDRAAPAPLIGPHIPATLFSILTRSLLLQGTSWGASHRMFV